MSAPDSTRLRTVGVVLAGGVGTRVGLTVPKQLLKIAGKPIIEHTLSVFESSSEIDEVVVLMTPGYARTSRQSSSRAASARSGAVVEGGATRNESTRRALDALGTDECNVLFHDAVRPLLTQRIIRECVNALRTYEAVDVAIPSADTNRRRRRRRHHRHPRPRPGCAAGRPRRGSGCRPSARLRAGLAGPALLGHRRLRRRAALPARRTHPRRRGLRAQHEGDRAGRRVHRGQALPAQLDVGPAAADDHAYSEQLRGRDAVVFGGSYGIGARDRVAAAEPRRHVFPFSRSTTRTHVQNADDVAAALGKAAAEPGGSTTSSLPPACSTPARWPRPTTRPSRR